MNLADYNIGGEQPQVILFEGDSGTGKSIAAAYFKLLNDTRNIYFASCDARMGSVAEWHRGRTDIEFDIFNHYGPLADKIEELKSNCPYQTLIIDPITNVSEMTMKYSFSLRGVIEYDEATGQAKKSSKGRKKGVVDLTTVEDYNTEHRAISDLISDTKQIAKEFKTNVIWTAHLLTTQYYDIGGKESRIRRDILTAGRKIAAFLPSQFDEIYHFTAEGGKWIVKTYNDGIVPARTSFLLMPKEIDWTNKNLYEEISKYYIPSDKKKEGE